MFGFSSIYSDLLCSCLVGVALAFTLISVGSRRSKLKHTKYVAKDSAESIASPIDASVCIGEQNVLNIATGDTASEPDPVRRNDSDNDLQLLPKINAEKALPKLEPLKHLFMLTDEQMEEAVRLTNMEIDNTNKDSTVQKGSRCRKTTTVKGEQNYLNCPVDDAIDASDFYRTLDWVVYLVAGIMACYAVNVYTRGDFGRILLGFFPNEFDSLKLKEYLQKFYAEPT